MTWNTCAWIVSAILLYAPGTWAGELNLLRGQLQATNRVWFETLVVILEEANNHTFAQRADVGPDGTFTLRSVTFGDYVLRVTDLGGDTICRQYVSTQQHMSELV